jgi:hypothetical protein
MFKWKSWPHNKPEKSILTSDVKLSSHYLSLVLVLPERWCAVHNELHFLDAIAASQASGIIARRNLWPNFNNGVCQIYIPSAFNGPPRRTKDIPPQTHGIRIEFALNFDINLNTKSHQTALGAAYIIQRLTYLPKIDARTHEELLSRALWFSLIAYNIYSRTNTESDAAARYLMRSILRLSLH